MKRKLIQYAILSLLFALLWNGLSLIGHSTPANSLAQSIAQQHLDDRPIPSPLVAQTPTQFVSAKTVTYGNLDNQPLTGYLARPSDATANLPAVIVIHEWWGLNDNIKRMSDRLAAEGYTALAVDLYGGNVADNPQQAQEYVTQAMQNPAKLEDNLLQAYQYLEKEQEALKIGVIGWCFGGKWSLNTALLLPQQIDATVIYYGGGMETDPQKLKTLEMPILGIFGELDNNPSPETVKEFEQTLASLGKTAQIYIYPDADHAFANPSGTRYQETAAKDAWDKTLTFLAQTLQTSK